MDRESVLLDIQTALSFLGQADISLKVGADDAAELDVISDYFKGMALSKRIDLISKAVLDISTTKLVDFDLVISPLTSNEFKNQVSETGFTSSSNSRDEGFAARP